MDKDSLVNEVIEYMKGKDDLTVSMLQRKFKIGYRYFRKKRLFDY